MGSLERSSGLSSGSIRLGRGKRSRWTNSDPVTRVLLSASAEEDLERLIRSHSLPKDTRQRLRRSLEPLRNFPLIGPALHGRWSGLRFLLGPWRWMLVVYVYIDDEDRIVVVTIQDGRSSTFAS